MPEMVRRAQVLQYGHYQTWQASAELAEEVMRNNNHKHNHHSERASQKDSGNSGHAHSMNHGSSAEFLRRFWIVTLLLIPLTLTNKFIAGFLGIGAFQLHSYIQFAVATVIFYFSLIFFKHARHEIATKRYGMMTLVSLAVGAGYLFSVASTFIPVLETEFYLEISTLIWVLLFGHYLEARSQNAAGNALKEIAYLLPKKAHLIDGEKETDIDISSLVKGDIVLVRSGEKVPADGIVLKGSARMDESLITGESKPVRRGENDQVIAGSVCLDGSLTVELERVGKYSTIGQIQTLIEKAQKTKPRAQRMADKAARILTITAGLTAVITVLVWSLILGESFVLAITLGITVLVIACPHALGLAIPTVTTVTTSLALKNGIFLKDLEKLEAVKTIDYVVFDKTGTLTEGAFGVSDVIALGSAKEKDIIKIVASLEKHSSHVIGRSVDGYAEKKGIYLEDVDSFTDSAGKGVSGIIKGVRYFFGNKILIDEKKILISGEAKQVYESLAGAGKTAIFLSNENRIIGIVALSDKIRVESYKAVEELHRRGIKVAMLSGDGEAVSRTVAQALKIDTYFAEVPPEEKYRYIKNLQEQGNTVLMVGDGVNDAPALTQADVGIAVGAGTDVAVEAGDIVLMKNNPLDVVRLLILSKKVYRKMVQNLAWALGYNIIALPAAAGAFAAWGLFLRPEIGALVMSLSTVIVVINAMTLKKTDLSVF
jgi:P-type Cu2+ transporter